MPPSADQIPRLLAGTRDPLTYCFFVDRATHAVEADESELDPAHVDHRDRAEARCLDAVALQQLVRGRDPLRPEVGQMVVGEVGHVRAHHCQTVDEPRVAAERERRGRHDGTTREQWRLQIDVRDVRVLRVVRGRAERPQEVVTVGGVVVDAPCRNHVAGDEQGPDTARVRRHRIARMEQALQAQNGKPAGAVGERRLVGEVWGGDQDSGAGRDRG